MTRSEAPHIRHGLGAVRPYLHGPVSLVDFLVDVLGAVELERHEFGPESFHVQLRIGDSMIALEAGSLSGESRPWTNSVYVYVEDVDTVYREALQRGATSISEPADMPYDERQAGFRDVAGNTWWVSRHQPAE